MDWLLVVGFVEIDGTKRGKPLINLTEIGETREKVLVRILAKPLGIVEVLSSRLHEERN